MKWQALTGLSRRTVIRLFANEPGLLVVLDNGNITQAAYWTIRIPQEVYRRVVLKRQ
jgi:hypothetical protein